MKSWLSRIVLLFEMIACYWLDAVIPATENIGNHFKHKSKTIVRNYPRLSCCSERKNRNNEVLTLVYAGALSKERGIVEIVEALSYVNDVRLVLMGKYAPESFGIEVKQMEGYNKVDYRGYIDYCAVFDEMVSADVGIVCLHPEKRFLESLPTKLFEYMMMGLPVIASDFPEWNKIVKDSDCGLLVNPLNPKCIAGAIKYFQDRPSEIIKRGNNGITAVQTKYNWGNEAVKLNALYKKITK